jgi:DNA topoisomerase-6 subunit B
MHTETQPGAPEGQASLLEAPTPTLTPALTTENPTVTDKEPASKRAPRATAESMAAKQRDISVSEFFAKNRHLLGFDNPRKALLTTVKEAVDNSLDACEEAGILPDITVVIEDLQPDRPASAKQSRYRVTVVDNGPGIVRKQVENVFGRLLFGSKFHRLKMSRGQQGIGISAAGMYGLITTGKPMLIQTRPDARKPAHHIELAMNTKTNRAEVTVDQESDDFPLARLRTLSSATRELADKGELLSQAAYPTGTCVSIELEGKYQRGRGSVDEFLELTAIANPHARFTLVRPTRVTEEEDDAPLLKKGQRAEGRGPSKDTPSTAPETAGASSSTLGPEPSALAQHTRDLGALVVFPRAVSQLPPETKEIQPHPRGVELGTLLQMVKDYEQAEKGGTLYHFLQNRFCRVSGPTAASFCEKIGATSRTKAADVEPPQIEKLFKEFMDSKLAPPPTDCLAPVGVAQLLKGMHKGVRAEFYAASSREAAVYRGRPFLIEAAIAYGGELPGDDAARVIRFANRVPLLFQQSACSSFKAVTECNWRNYDLQQPRGGLPVGPLVIMIHMASVWVPFTSESKEAIADYDEIRKEMKLALMECGRKLGTYLRKRAAMRRQGERRDVFERYIGEISSAIHAINGADARKVYDALLTQARKHTAIADLQMDEDGRTVKDEDPADSEGVLIVDVPSEVAPPATARTTGAPPLPEAPAPKGRKPAKARVRGTDDDLPENLLTTSRREQNMLTVAAAEKLGTDARPAKRATKPAPASAAKPATKAAKNAKPAPTPAAPAPTAKPLSKPKMRLVNGKLVPVDESPKLF